jgi:hypothetical protein
MTIRARRIFASVIFCGVAVVAAIAIYLWPTITNPEVPVVTAQGGIETSAPAPQQRAIAARVKSLFSNAPSSANVVAWQELESISTITLEAIIESSWVDLEAMFQAKGLVPDTEVARMVRDDFRNRPPQFRPANLDSLSDAELVALRTADKAKPLATIHPSSISAVTIAPGEPPEIAARFGDTKLLEAVLASGCAGRCIRSEFAYTSSFLRELESHGAAHQAAVLIEGVAQAREKVILVIGFTYSPQTGWVPRWITSIASEGAGGFYWPRI